MIGRIYPTLETLSNLLSFDVGQYSKATVEEQAEVIANVNLHSLLARPADRVAARSSWVRLLPLLHPDKYAPEQIGGGKAMRLLPSILVTLKKKPLLENESVKGSPIVGNKITATTVKNRGYPPFQESTIMIDYEKGVLPFAGVLELAVEAGIVEQNGAWYSYGDERLGQGKINAMKALEKVPEILDKIDVWLENTGYSTHNEEAEQAEQIIQEELEDVEVKKIRGRKK